MARNYMDIMERLHKAQRRSYAPTIWLRTKDRQVISIRMTSRGGASIVLNGLPVGLLNVGGDLEVWSNSTVITQALIELSDDFVGTLREQGQRVGTCGLCLYKLDTAESKWHGYNPLCAHTFGLPFSPTATTVMPLAPLGEADKMLRDIDNATLDSQIEGVQKSIEIIKAFHRAGVTDPDEFINILEALINDLKDAKA